MSVAGVIMEHDMRTRGWEHGRRGFFTTMKLRLELQAVPLNE